MKILLVAASLIGGSLAANAGQAAITSGPNDLTINAGSTADFVVTASNATSYQWSFQGTNILGATNAELDFSGVSTNQAGAYSVIVGGSTGTNITNSASLTVLQGTIVNLQISGFASGPSNVLVELFDHDKPATVQNFFHYINSGAYSNLFFDRLIPGFVLQGGAWDAADRTNSTPPPGVIDVYQDYVLNGIVQNPPLPQQVDSEFYVGPKVSNLQGTIAMALPPGNPDGASSSFFFNLVDNTNLDTVASGGPFTVFGWVLNGADVLAYFNNTNAFFKPAFTAPPTLNIFTNGIFDQIFLSSNATTFTDLPVNYDGTNVPADSNLFFVDFTYPAANAQPVIDTTPPTAAITFPPANVVLTNGISLTVLGTAQDDVGLARVICNVFPENGANGGAPFGNNADGTTNWSLPLGVLEPGIYNFQVVPQDGAGNGPGNPGSLVKQTIIISAVLTNGVGSVFATNLSTGAPLGNAVGANLVAGTHYALFAQPGPGWIFVYWSYGTNVSFNPNLSIQMADNMVLTANFTVLNGIAFTSPVGGNTANGTFSIAGVVGGGGLTPPVTVTCSLYSYTNHQLVGPVRQVTTTNNWSFPVANLALGHYYAVVTAQDTLGQSAALTNDFTAGLPMTVLAGGNGRGAFAPNYDGHFLAEGQHYTMTATPAAGSLFDAWSDGVNYTNNRAVRFTMTPGLVLTATFVSNDFPVTISSPIAFAWPAPGARLTNQTFNLAGTINPAIASPVVSYQLFYGSNSVTAPSATNVTILPGAAPARSTWSAGLTNLTPGYYTAVATVSDVNGRSSLVSESFQVLAQVLLQINPAGYGVISSNKASWTGQYVAEGVPISLTAKTNGGHVFAFWSNNVTGGLYANNSLAFIATNNMTLTAHFDSNYFFNVAGTYNGLFTNGLVSPTNSGFYTLTVTSNGAISVKLCLAGRTYPATGQFPLYNPAGYAGAGFFWKGLDGKYVTNIVYLDLTGGSESLVGYVTNAEFYSALRAFRATTSLAGNSVVNPGTNVFLIPGDHSATNNHPGGDSYAAFTLGANGAIKLIGHLADNTSFSQSTAVSTNYLYTNGIWPFYASLYGGKGIILGWETNTSPTNFAAEVAWSKPATLAKPGIYYTNAFLFVTNSYSDGCVPPAAGTHYQIAFGGASLTNGLTNTLTVAANGLFTVDPNQANKLALTFTPKSGVLTGSFSYPSGLVTHNFYGAFISPSLGGSGYFLDTNSQTGFFEIHILP